MAPVALSTSHISATGRCRFSSSSLSSQFSVLSPPPFCSLPHLTKRNRLPSSAHLRCSSRLVPPRASSSGISLEHVGDQSQGSSGQAELLERLRAAVLQLRSILPGGSWWRLEEESMEDGGRGTRRKAVPVFTALRQMWVLVADDRWVIFLGFGSLALAAVRPALF